MAPIISKTDSGHSSNYSNLDDIFFSYGQAISSRNDVIFLSDLIDNLVFFFSDPTLITKYTTTTSLRTGNNESTTSNESTSSNESKNIVIIVKVNRISKQVVMKVIIVNLIELFFHEETRTITIFASYFNIT
jgi:hypothetical protein